MADIIADIVGEAIGEFLKLLLGARGIWGFVIALVVILLVIALVMWLAGAFTPAPMAGAAPAPVT